jgi:hypothetical protein
MGIPIGCTDSEVNNVWHGAIWGERYYQSDSRTVEYWFLDVDGTTVLVEAARPTESTKPQTRAFSAVLDSLVIAP